jgi:predicted RNA binding protein YcfA (HicA-like mRNA interferase family)
VLKHPDKPAARVTLPIHVGETLYLKTLLSILNQAGMTVEEFRELL